MSARGRWIEFTLLFVVAPAAFAAWGTGRVPVLPVLWVGALYARRVLRHDPAYEGPSWRGDTLGREWKGIAVRFLIGGVALIGAVWLLAPDRLFDLPRERPGLWAIIMVAYPLLSVVPQELLWRTFMFHRYRDLMPERAMILVSGLAFGGMHVVFLNPIAIALTLVAGVAFAWGYARHRSLAAASLEHALFGCLLFTVGLGSFFYAGGGG